MASPIEAMLYEAILRHRPETQIVYVHSPDSHRYRSDVNEFAAADTASDVLVDVFGDEDDEASDVNAAIDLHRGVAVASYRVDILLVRDRWRRLVVECDGHEFHDRTKQQAAYDRARDRELLRLGFTTVRFTGSEIVHGPDRCASEVWSCLAALHDIELRTELAWRHGWECGAAHATSKLANEVRDG